MTTVDGIQLPADHPIAIYDKCVRDHKLKDDVDSLGNWEWSDQVIINDFKKLKRPPTRLTINITNLQAFYLTYLGDLATPTNVGALFLNLIANAPHFTEKGNLIPFTEKGTHELTTYTAPPSLKAVYDRFMKESVNDVGASQNSVITPPPTEVAKLSLVDEEEDQEAEDSKPKKSELAAVRTFDTRDTISFREEIRNAFKDLFNTEENDLNETNEAYRKLYLTASFLILFLMRRVTKRDQDIINALNKGRIHKHYTDMVATPLSLFLLPPASTLNRTLDQALSAANPAGRELATIILYLYKSCATTHVKAPIGLLDQQGVGLEAVLRATCMTHIAGAGLPLVTLFLALKTKFGMTERDAIIWLSYPELELSVTRLVTVRTKHQILSKEKKEELTLFPYCRLVHQRYHADLGAKGNDSHDG